jgi:hypothetical protein
MDVLSVPYAMPSSHAVEPPTARTLASWSTVNEWPARANWMPPVGDHVSLVGSYVSAVATAGLDDLPHSLGLVLPPVIRTRPSSNAADV